MKSKIVMIVLTLGLAIPSGARGTPFQDLDRINDIVNQARGLAQSARADTVTRQSGSVHGGFNNPFAKGTNSHNMGVIGADGTAVEIDGNQIRVNAGGRQFVFPRSGSPAISEVVGPDAGNHSVDATLDRVAGYRNFAEAVQLFRNADFGLAAKQMENSVTASASQPMFEPFYSLCLFANGDYIRSAEFAYSAASRSRIWEWEQLKGYYGNPEQYSHQYRELQSAANDPNADVSVQFLLGYHHLMLGHRDHARRQFEKVLTKLPNDPVTRNLLTITNQGPPLPMQ